MNEYGTMTISLADDKGNKTCFAVDWILRGIEAIKEVEETVNAILSILNKSEQLKCMVDLSKHLQHIENFFLFAKEISENGQKEIQYKID